MAPGRCGKGRASSLRRPGGILHARGRDNSHQRNIYIPNRPEFSYFQVPSEKFFTLRTTTKPQKEMDLSGFCHRTSNHHLEAFIRNSINTTNLLLSSWCSNIRPILEIGMLNTEIMRKMVPTWGTSTPV
jgi:hypothetical protein